QQRVVARLRACEQQRRHETERDEGCGGALHLGSFRRAASRRRKVETLARRLAAPDAAGGVPVLLSSRGGEVLGLDVGGCGWWLVGGSGLEHGEDEVAAAAGEAGDGGVVCLALG